MPQMDRARIAKLIQALLAKTEERGCTQGEAMEAASKARELMDRYQIDSGEVGMAEEGVTKITRPRAKIWQLDITSWVAVAIGGYCDCRVWQSQHEDVKGVAFFGLRSDAEFAGWLHDSLTAFVKSEAARYLLTLRATDARSRWAHQKDFALGCLSQISRRLNQLAAERKATQQVAVATSRALVVVKSQMVAREFAKLGLRLRSTSWSVRTSGATGAREAGTQAGNSASFGRPVGNGATAQRLLNR